MKYISCRIYMIEQLGCVGTSECPVHSMTILTEMLGVMAYKFQHVEHQQNIEIYYKTFASLEKVMKLSIFETKLSNISTLKMIQKFVFHNTSANVTS